MNLLKPWIVVGITVAVVGGSGWPTLRFSVSTAPDQQRACQVGVGEIAYQASIDSAGRENVEVFVACADGSAKRRLTINPRVDGAPVWSPDGRRIAFHASRDTGIQRGTIPVIAIYVMNADGSDVHRVVDRFGMNPTWSPDGEWLAFVSLPALSPADSADVKRWSAQRDIFVVRVDGTGLRNLSNAMGSDNYPSWSPDGRQVAFSSIRMEGEDWAEIYVINTDGTGTRRLTFNHSGMPGCCEDAAPTWSPDSRWLAFISKRAGNSEVYKMHRDGSQQQRLTRDSIFDGYPAWSADGENIAFEKHRAAPRIPDGPPRTPDSLYIMRADGGERRPLGIAGTRPAWRWR